MVLVYRCLVWLVVQSRAATLAAAGTSSSRSVWWLSRPSSTSLSNAAARRRRRPCPPMTMMRLGKQRGGVDGVPSSGRVCGWRRVEGRRRGRAGATNVFFFFTVAAGWTTPGIEPERGKRKSPWGKAGGTLTAMGVRGRELVRPPPVAFSKTMPSAMPVMLYISCGPRQDGREDGGEGRRGGGRPPPRPPPLSRARPWPTSRCARGRGAHSTRVALAARWLAARVAAPPRPAW